MSTATHNDIILPHTSRRAARRVGAAALPVPATCRYCDGPVALVNNADIYNGRSYGGWPYAYLCRACNAYTGVHPHSDIPLGTLANAELRQARRVNKADFETLRHQSGRFDSRGDAYQWLASQMGISGEHCHWGHFEIDQCGRAGAICRAELQAITP